MYLDLNTTSLYKSLNMPPPSRVEGLLEMNFEDVSVKFLRTNFTEHQNAAASSRVPSLSLASHPARLSHMPKDQSNVFGSSDIY